MNTISLQIFSIIGVLIYFILIVFFLKKKSLSLKYTLTWFALGICMSILAVIPRILNYIAQILGIQLPVNALFSILFFFVLMIMMTLTAIVSKQGLRIRILVQNSALLEERIRKLESK